MNTEATAPTEQQLSLPAARRVVRVQAGFIVEPPLWSTSKSAKNWCAVVEPNGHRPGGLDRRFLKTGRGELRYSTYGIRTGDVLEFAAEDRVHASRDFYVVEGFENGNLILTAYAKVLDAMDRSKAVRAVHERRVAEKWAAEQAERQRVEAERQKVRDMARAARLAMGPGAPQLLRRKASLVGKIERLERELKEAREGLGLVEQQLAAREQKGPTS